MPVRPPNTASHNPGERVYPHIVRVSVFINPQSFEGCIFIQAVRCCRELCWGGGGGSLTELRLKSLVSGAEWNRGMRR